MSPNWVKLTSRAAAATVAVVAGFSSWQHIVEVARDAGEVGRVAGVLPLSIDGLIVVGTMAMIEDKRAGRRPRLSARVALGFGVVATLAANIASAEPTMTARLVAAVPAVAFLIAVEVLARTGRPLAVSAVEGEPDRSTLAGDPDNPAPPDRTEPLDKVSSPEPAPRKPLPSARDRVQRAHRRDPAATHRQLAERLNLSTKTVQRWRPPKADEPAQVNGSEPRLLSAQVGSDGKE